MNTRRQGFTLLELIVVIAVIGILAAITIIGFSQYQRDTRDARRASSVAAITEALEKYYDENGEYPSCPNVTASGTVVISDTLAGIDQSTLVAPAAPNDTTNSLKCEDLTLNGEDFFEYEGDGSTTCATGGSCLEYTLRYKEEGTGTIKAVESRRTASIATSGIISNLNATTTSPSSISLTWATVPNAANYTVQRSLDSTFTSGDPESTVSSTLTTVTGLNPATEYFFRVRPNAPSSQGAWSNVANATTETVTPPTIAATTASSTAINVSWADVTYEDSYKLEYSTNNFSTVTGTVDLAANTTSRQVSSLTTGQTYYFRVTAIKTGDYSAESNVDSATPIGQAVIASTSASACGEVTISWSALAGAETYTIRHSTNSNMSGATSITGVTGTSRVVTGLSQGSTIYFTVSGVTSSNYTGQASSVASELTSICTPAAYSVSSSGGSGLTATSNAVCAAGTTPYYQWYANGGAWVAGTQYQSVTYSLGYGQGITLSVNTRCDKSGVTSSGWRGGSNAPGYTRPVPAPTLNALTSGGGRRVNASWSAVCGGLNELLLQQGSYTDTSANRFALPNNYGTTDTRLWNSAGTVSYHVRTNCNGVWSGWSNQQTRYVS